MKRKVTTIVVGLTLLIMAAVPAGVSASTADPAKADLSSLPAIEAYLRSIGVDPGLVVVQQGALNYAGPNCPGEGWNCTTASMVVQISTSTSPGANIFDCLPALDATFPALNECLIVQSSVLSVVDPPPPNDATCTPTFSSDGTTKSKCTIRQSSKKGNNSAEVRASTTQRGGTLQTATQDATITQTSDSGNNTAKITETIDQSLNIGTPDDPLEQQQARQTATVDQKSGAGNNSSDVQLTMLQVENAQSNSAITQEQNQNTGSPGFNLDASISQMSSSSGNNSSNLSGQLTQRQNAGCASCLITQKQGSPALDGGLRGRVNQSTVSGTANKSAANLSESQTQHADSSVTPSQKQVGPVDCCATQTGGSDLGNSNSVNETVAQQNNKSIPTADQQSQEIGTCREFGTLATCTVNLITTQNGTTTPNSCTAQACGIFISCPGEGACFTGFVGLKAPPPGSDDALTFVVALRETIQYETG